MDAALLIDSEFPTVDRQHWLDLVRKTLGESTFEDALVSTTDDGIAIDPLYSRSKDARLLPRTNAQGWKILQRADDADPARANAQAKADLSQGAAGLSIVFEGAPNGFGYGLPAAPETLATLLDGIDMSGSHLRIDLHPQSRASVDWMVEYLTANRADPKKLNLSFGINPAGMLAGTGRFRMSIEAVKASLPQSLAHFFGLGVPGILLEADGRVFHNGGATEAQELGAMLSSAVSHLRMFEDARQPLVYAVPKIGFAISVDQDQFVSMAKIRALRLLWARVLESCQVEPASATIHAETSYRMMTVKDPETNILRNTIACFAAVTGGADTISVLPHTLPLGLPDGFARRVARNTQIILDGESHVGFVADPATGSGAVEALTAALCEAGWNEFRRIEAEGGMLTSLEANAFQERVRAARDARIEKYRANDRSIVGTTIFPAEAERKITTLDAERRDSLEDGVVYCEALPAGRIDELLGDAG